MPVITPDNWHQTLGVAPNASHEQIKRAFRRRVRACHPDLNRGSRESEAELKRIIEAYRTASAVRMKRRSERIEAAFRSAGSSAARAPSATGSGGGVLNLASLRRGVVQLAAVSGAVALLACVGAWAFPGQYRPVRVDATVFLRPYIDGSAFGSSRAAGWYYDPLPGLR